MYYIYGAITVGLLFLGIFRFPNCIGRLIESGRDFGLSIAYAFTDAFDGKTKITPTVNTLPNYSFLNLRNGFYALFKKSA